MQAGKGPRWIGWVRYLQTTFHKHNLSADNHKWLYWVLAVGALTLHCLTSWMYPCLQSYIHDVHRYKGNRIICVAIYLNYHHKGISFLTVFLQLSRWGQKKLPAETRWPLYQRSCSILVVLCCTCWLISKPLPRIQEFWGSYVHVLIEFSVVLILMTWDVN